MLAANDQKDLLRDIPAINVTRKTQWVVNDPKTESLFYRDLDQRLIDKLETDNFAFHYHDWAVSYEDFNKSASHFFKVTQIDTLAELNNLEFVIGAEAHNYPIFGVLFHPEYQWLNFSHG